MADSATIAAVLEHVQRSKLPVPVSVALGEAVDWIHARTVPRLSGRIAWLKLGTAGLGTGGNWESHFDAVKCRFQDEAFQAAGGLGETASDGLVSVPNWIAVAYADWEVANGPAPEEVIETAASCGLAGVLIDTFSKESGGLFDQLTGDRIESLAGLIRCRGLSLGLAGRLKLSDVAKLLAIGPEIVGIRSAACRGGTRSGDIDPAAVSAFRKALGAGSYSPSPLAGEGRGGGASVSRILTPTRTLPPQGGGN